MLLEHPRKFLCCIDFHIETLFAAQHPPPSRRLLHQITFKSTDFFVACKIFHIFELRNKTIGLNMKKLAFGIDIGGINTAFGLVDEKGDL